MTREEYKIPLRADGSFDEETMVVDLEILEYDESQIAGCIESVKRCRADHGVYPTSIRMRIAPN